MNKRKTKTWAGVRNVGLVLVVLCIVLAATSSAVAAPSESTTQTSVRPMTVLDPFSLKVVAVSGNPSTKPSTTVKAVGSTASDKPTGRLSIRIPPRLPARSAFNPVL